MKSPTVGNAISDTEVTHVSAHGLWLMVNGAEHFLPYDQFPWFKDATLGQILNVQLLHGEHLHWPDLDVDLHVESLATPAAYPLVYR
jgi:hypothetical protein